MYRPWSRLIGISPGAVWPSFGDGMAAAEEVGPRGSVADLAFDDLPSGVTLRRAAVSHVEKGGNATGDGRSHLPVSEERPWTLVLLLGQSRLARILRQFGT